MHIVTFYQDVPCQLCTSFLFIKTYLAFYAHSRFLMKMCLTSYADPRFSLRCASLIVRSGSKSTMPFSPFENEVRPGVVHTLQDFSFAEVKIFVVIKQGGDIWLPYQIKKEELAVHRKTLRLSSFLQV